MPHRQHGSEADHSKWSHDKKGLATGPTKCKEKCLLKLEKKNLFWKIGNFCMKWSMTLEWVTFCEHLSSAPLVNIHDCIVSKKLGTYLNSLILFWAGIYNLSSVKVDSSLWRMSRNFPAVLYHDWNGTPWDWATGEEEVFWWRRSKPRVSCVDLRLLPGDKNKISYEDSHDQEACAFAVVYYDKKKNSLWTF